MVELLEWSTVLVVDFMHERDDVRDAQPADRELLQTAGAVLGGVASLLAGRDARLDLELLERRRAASAAQLDTVCAAGDRSRGLAQIAFHAQSIAFAVRLLAADALVASRLADPDTIAAQRRQWSGAAAAQSERRWAGVRRASGIARRHASVRSVWFINSARGALALAAAVAVADLSSVQHGFWVVLGTLSVLRTNASSTGSTALRALAGTVIGFAIGAALIVAIGTSSAALWIALPIAVFVAAYAPGTAPFAVGQAGFTVVVSVLFNLLVPVGWTVGLVRIEDVAIGCAVSIVVGILFWPRGVAGVVADDLADEFRRRRVLSDPSGGVGARGAGGGAGRRARGHDGRPPPR